MAVLCAAKSRLAFGEPALLKSSTASLRKKSSPPRRQRTSKMARVFGLRSRREYRRDPYPDHRVDTYPPSRPSDDGGHRGRHYRGRFLDHEAGLVGLVGALL